MMFLLHCECLQKIYTILSDNIHERKMHSSEERNLTCTTENTYVKNA